MKDSSTDQLVLMAQMMTDTMHSGLHSILNRHLPLIVIIVVGLAVATLALLATRQWERHIETTIFESTENNYLNQFESKVSLLRRDANVTAGFVKASQFVSQEEFQIFTHDLIAHQGSSDFVAIHHYGKDRSIHYLNANLTQNISELETRLQTELNQQQQTLKSMDVQGAFFLTSPSKTRPQHLIHMLYMPNSISNGSSETAPLIIAGISLDHLITPVPNSNLDIMVNIIDQLGTVGTIDTHQHDQKTPLHELISSSDKLAVTFRLFESDRGTQNQDYFSWLLVGFSLVFTLLLVLQFILAKRSIRGMASLAVQRANDLTAINSELTEEIINRVRYQDELVNKTREIETANKKLAEAKSQLIQQEKLASLGQLAAGVAHEINNPVGFINSNLSMLSKYSNRLLSLIDSLDDAIKQSDYHQFQLSFEQKKQQYKFDSAKKNILPVIEESQEGVDRVKKIVHDLKNFSRVDEAEWQWADIHQGIDSTLNIARNEIKYKAEVHLDYGDLPLVECVPSQINQVILNLLVNSAQAMESTGNIYIRTWKEGAQVGIEVKDDGSGIPDTIIDKIFDPFFTTKEVGKGTGLGLSLSYGIVQKHQGTLSVKSQPGVGTEFIILLPIKQQILESGVQANG